MRVVAAIDSERFVLNGRAIREGRPVAEFHELLGRPDRIDAAGPPAPVGHRNNQIHRYDILGLWLNEHHYTFLIQAITFVLWKDQVAFPTHHEFDGELKVGGVRVTPGVAEVEMTASTIPWISRLRGTWHFEGDSLWIGFETKGRKGPGGHRSKKRYLTSLSVCLPHDPWDARFRPNG